MTPPTDTERLFVTGHTGSGKSTDALWQLSNRSFDAMPWCVIDLKGNDLVARLPVTATLALADAPPSEPGLYAVTGSWSETKPRGPLDTFLQKALAQGSTGIMIDEGQLIDHRDPNPGLRMVLTQGRSRRVPLIFVCQRPVHVDTFALSESQYLQLFLLPHPDDQDRVARYVPKERLDFATLREAGEHHSFWYDVRRDELEILAPCPPFEDIYDRILTRLPRYEDEAAGPPPERLVRL